MSILNPWWLLPAIALAVTYGFFRSPVTDDWQRVIRAGVLQFLRSTTHNTPKRCIPWLIAAIACIALSAPSIQSVDGNNYRHSQGWIVIADVSRSMTITDVAPSRLSAMRNVALELADRANANSTTLIAYSGDAFMVTPPSFDNTYFQHNVALLEHGIVPLEGSNLTRAISLALSVIDGSKLVNARLFVLSDSGGFNSRSEAAIARLASLGHRSDIILFGSSNSGTAAPFDIELAQSLADSGRGRLLMADSIGQVSLADLDLQTTLSDQQFLTRTGLNSIRWRNQSHWLLLLAIPLMLWLFYREQQR